MIQEPEKEAQPHRPTGVSVLTALVIIGGITDLVAGAFSLVVASVYLSWLGILAGVGPAGLLLSLVSFGSFIAGVLSFILGYGLWKSRGWAWTWTLVFSIIGLIISIIAIAAGVGIIGVVIYAVVIYYLTRRRVKAYFGKARAPSETLPIREPPTSRPERTPEATPSVLPALAKLRSLRYKTIAIAIVALLAGIVLGSAIAGPAPQLSQQAPVYVTQTISREVTAYVVTTVTQQVAAGTEATTIPPTQEGNRVRVGQPFIIKEGADKIPIEITFTAAWFTTAHKWRTADEGYKFLVIEIRAKNLGIKETVILCVVRWEVTVDKGYVYKHETCDLSCASIRPEETKTGYVLFEILATTTPIEARYYGSLWVDDPTLVLDMRGESIATKSP